MSTKFYQRLNPVKLGVESTQFESFEVKTEFPTRCLKPQKTNKISKEAHWQTINLMKQKPFKKATHFLHLLSLIVYKYRTKKKPNVLIRFAIHFKVDDLNNLKVQITKRPKLSQKVIRGKNQAVKKFIIDRTFFICNIFRHTST